MFHKILQRQIKKYFGDENKISSEYLPLIQTISDTYIHNDQDRELIGRALELNSQEMIEKNQHLEQEKKNLQTKTDELERINKLMVNRELKMIQLKKEVVELTKPLSK